MSPHTAHAVLPGSPADHEAQDQRQIGRDALLEAHACEWRRWFLAGTAAGDMACDLPECDGDAWQAVARLVQFGLLQPWTSPQRHHAENVVTALAQLAADREVAG